ncbi:MAG: hypothetical protein IJX91_04035 [Clostridia bacterium]|nr:hypothetical protein [Clostridia bacterium]
MRNKAKKALGIVLAAATLSTAFAFVGCNDNAYKGDAVTGYVSNAEVKSNGGFAVEKGEFVYFINGQENYTADNVYGDVVKGALMRISKADLAAGKNDSLKTIVPSLFVAQDYTSGIYIYGDYVYYATPTTDKDVADGTVANTYIDFKRAKLDGSEAPMSDYFFRLSDNAAIYRYVQDETTKTVYCVYEETVTKADGSSALQLKSYNVSTGTTEVLVEGASDFYYDSEDLTNPYIYYTMNVSVYLDSDNSQSVTDYNQLYRVNAAATAKVTDEAGAKYTVYNGTTKIKEYDFDENYLKEKNDEAEQGKALYDLGKYSTYPYVNLGSLVLDGIGKSATVTQFNWHAGKAEDRAEQGGYTYTIKGYQDGGLYFTRTAKPGTLPSDKMYYLGDEKITAEWDSMVNNAESNFETVALSTTNTGSAIFWKNEDIHYYFYTNEAKTVLYRAGYDNETNAKIEETAIVTLTGDSNTISLWKVDAESKYLYYFSGNNLSRVPCDGTKEDYNHVQTTDFDPVELPAVNCNTSWYKPEIIGDTVLYSGAQTFGSSSTAYNYIYAANMDKATEMQTKIELYKDVQKDIEDTSNADLKELKTYYYRTGKTHSLYESQKEEYAKSVIKGYDEFVAKFAEGKEFANGTEANFISPIGKMKEDDTEAVSDAWETYLTLSTDDTDEEDDGLPTWAIWLIACGSAAIVIAAVVVTLVIVHKKKVAKQKEEEATVNAYKRKRIDTTDDKTIDVYADDEAEEAQTETAEEAPAEEAAEAETVETEATETDAETEEEKGE